MPPIDCGEHLVDLLWKWGPTLRSSMGESPLTHQEISYCQVNTGVELSSWEAETLAMLSKAYFSESHSATKPDCKPPFEESDDGAKLKQAEFKRKMRAFLD